MTSYRVIQREILIHVLKRKNYTTKKEKVLLHKWNVNPVLCIADTSSINNTIS